jgi:GntR family transcriptional repressor for pyruvate dehydrogenase complex
MAHQTLGQEVVERLRGDLTSGVFKPGEKLPPERELMTRYNAGRNTVREAVQGLVALGMLEVKAGYGTTVSRHDGRAAIARSMADRPLDEAALVDLAEFRLLLEGEAASLAALRATPEDLALIRGKLAAYQDAVRRSEAVYPHDVAFHRAVSSAAHNSFYLEVIDMSSQLFQGAMQAADRAPGDVLKAAEEHALIAHHVLLGDAEAARKAMRAHILAGNERRLVGKQA